MTPSKDRLLSVVSAFQGRRIAVVADLVIDEFLNGRVERISREAPVLILQYEGSDLRLGGGANAVHNIKTLGGEPFPVGFVGNDRTGQSLLALLKRKRIQTVGVGRAPAYGTPLKTRILGGGFHSTRQQIVRMDRTTPLPASGQPRVEAHVRRVLRRIGPVDGVLVSDYGLGLVTPEVLKLSTAFARRHKAPLTADSRHALLGLEGVTAVTPNEPEVEEALGVTIGHDVKKLEKAGKNLQARLKTPSVLVTRGSDGMSLFEAGEPPRHIPVFGSDEVADVTGAGDTVIATFTLALAAGASSFEAAHLANIAGGLVVMKRGTATVSARELRHAIRGAEFA
ncbi:MAG: bifunctional hydroxymethylpyrimidine kinase/phosphomethylpyrimidine kinase [Vicinamibacteria bacterium]|jgi:rfaE bifunctional protein kinase chain/domain|nr:bifunctional hydroxymethylpyrimidine kinase/phosphomethylpyrimidine kinase [Vicinamibacteria bacterium]MBP9947182.1 bifunctional hydroxymethylpyrimidine kinase/phosphomethylpyrimidine kinase [Vicinamibacteria bacterium]